MASATAAPVKTIAAMAAMALSIGATRTTLRSIILSTFTGPGATSRVVALIVVIANFKSFPFVWHIRVWNALIRHFAITPKTHSPPSTPGVPLLFQPTITTSRSPFTECDYNLHKSNSTYFSDLDVTRSHLVCVLLRQGIKRLQDTPGVVVGPDGVKAKGRWLIMLGGVQTTFRKEIKPYEKYEMWSRILCWDRKWIYIVTHFVKAGAVRPDGYSIDDGRSLLSKLVSAKKGRDIPEPVEKLLNGNVLDSMVPNKAIFASAISKYVIKLGRLTIHPEVVIDASGLLPPRPGGWNTMSGEKPQMNGVAETNVSNRSVFMDDVWDWKRIEAENKRGMKYAEHLAALDGLLGEFSGEDRPAVGVYNDPF